MAFAPGSVVGPYRILEELGRGGMATVWKAYHEALERHVAIKVLHPSFTEEEAFLDRFQQEAKALARLSHPNIVPIHDYSEHQGSPYLVMRYVEGHSLHRYLHGRRLSLGEVLEIVRPVGEALAYAHGQGVVHRDIKPGNIMLTFDGEVVLSDFGLAKLVEKDEALARELLMGTPQYISPEQAKADPLDNRTDLYSLGIVLFEMIAQRVPFDGDTPYDVIHRHIYDPPPSVSAFRADLPSAIDEVLQIAMAKQPQDRYPDIQTMMADLEAAILGTERARPQPRAAARVPLATELAPPAERRGPGPERVSPVRRPPYLLLAGAVLLLAACGVVFLALNSGLF